MNRGIKVLQTSALPLGYAALLNRLPFLWKTVHTYTVFDPFCQEEEVIKSYFFSDTG